MFQFQMVRFKDFRLSMGNTGELCFNSKWCDLKPAVMPSALNFARFQFQMVRFKEKNSTGKDGQLKQFQFQMVRFKAMLNGFYKRWFMGFNSKWCDLKLAWNLALLLLLLFQFQMVRFKGFLPASPLVWSPCFNSKWCDLKRNVQRGRHIIHCVSIPNGAI